MFSTEPSPVEIIKRLVASIEETTNWKADHPRKKEAMNAISAIITRIWRKPFPVNDLQRLSGTMGGSQSDLRRNFYGYLKQ